MRPFYFLYASTILFVSIFVLALIFPTVESATGITHSQYPGINISIRTVADDPMVKWLSYFYGLSIIALLSGFLWIGNLKAGKPTQMLKAVILMITCYVVAYTCMVTSHWHYTHSDTNEFAGFLPIPTAWMIWGMWFIPAIYTIIYVFKFDDWVISPEEEEEIKSFIAAHKNRK